MTLVSTFSSVQYAQESFPLRKPGDASNDSSKWIVSSPYLGKLHLLNLDTLDKQSRLLALTLTELQATPDYALVEYERAFDFDGLLDALRRRVKCEGLQWQQQDFYVVEFRSKVQSDIDSDLLYTLDEKSHEEATQSGGLLKYWYGSPDAERRNLATCEQARTLIGQPTNLSRLLEE